MTEKEIFLACCGNNELGDNKSDVAIKLCRINLETGEEDVLDEMIFDNPIVSILRNPRFVMVDLTFTNKADFEFINLVARLQDFSNVQNSAENETATIGPTIIVTVLPKEYKGEYYASGMHAVWVVMPSRIGAPMDTVRFIFDNELFAAYRSDISNVDMEALEDELWNEELADEH